MSPVHPAVEAPGAASPTTLRQLLALFRRHGEIVITRQDSIHSGNCRRDTDRFIRDHLDGRTEVPLAELMPFLERDHYYWPNVTAAVEHKLTEAGILSAGYMRHRTDIEAPRRFRRVALKPSYHT